MQEMDKDENIVMAHFRNFLRFHVARRFEHRVRHQGSVGGGGDSKRPRQFVMIKLQQGDLASLSAATPRWDTSAFNPSLFSQFWAQLQSRQTFNRLHLGNCCMTRIFGALTLSRKAPREVSQSVKVSKSLHAVSTAVTGCSCSAFIGGKQANNRVIHPCHLHPQNITSQSNMSKPDDFLGIYHFKGAQQFLNCKL